MHIWASAPSLRLLEHRSMRQDHWIEIPGTDQHIERLTKSGLSEMLRGTRIPPYRSYLTYLWLCGVKDMEAWMAAWQRCKAFEAFTKSAAEPGPGTVSA